MNKTRQERKKRAVATYAALESVHETVALLLENQLHGLGLSLVQFRVLEALRDGGEQTQAEIASTIFRHESHVHAILRSMEEQGLVTRRAHHSDGRKNSVSLTPAGEKLIRQVAPLREKVIHARMLVLPGRDQEILRRLCEKLEQTDTLKFILELTRPDDDGPEEE